MIAEPVLASDAGADGTTVKGMMASYVMAS
ncbi:MAG: hypothetical protein RIS70_3712 [Planctomycetota bacterium]|jgi:hypothetical protein